MRIDRPLVQNLALLCCHCLRLILLFAPVSCGRSDVSSSIEAYAYPDTVAAACATGGRTGRAGASDGQVSADGVRYHVRTPSNYDAAFAHPLLMVYAAAGRSGLAMERLTGLTPVATNAGLIVAYVDHQPLDVPAVERLGSLPSEIAKIWCVDERRVYATGHSDGGTVALALALLDRTKDIPAAIAPSAAGWNGKDLAAYQCPAPLPVMVMHGKNDRLFPGWGRQTADWWASCNRCDMTKAPVAESGCLFYQGCEANGPTLYCEGSGGHRDWPGVNRLMMEFFTQPEKFRRSPSFPLSGRDDLKE
ncbi:MAG: hypothetical protein NZM29_08530 [Nitrospira sp.]|nr:hypothetical protein [Nitrospira sp.]